MADLDALLDDAAAELPTVIDVDQMLKDSKKMDNVKPWLAFSSNVPPAIRDKWSQMVKVDALSKTDNELRASNSYYEWESTNPLPGSGKLLQELIRDAATSSGFDERQISQLMNAANPVIETEAAKALQTMYTDQLVKDLAPKIKKETDYDAQKFPNLADKMKALNV